MGRRGPVKRPTALEERLGNPKKQRKNPHEPKPKASSRLNPPAYLDTVAKKEWKRVAPKLKELGLLTEIDEDALAAYCQALSDFIGANKVIQKKGNTFQTKTGYLAPRPEVAIRRQAVAQILKFAEQFGMTPGSRARMVVSLHPPKKGKTSLDDLLA